jgi:uncharacterized protein YkwD
MHARGLVPRSAPASGVGRTLMTCLLALVVSAGALIVVPAHRAGAAPGTDPVLTEYLVGISINAARARAGLAPLQLDPALSFEARGWSARQAAANRLSHDPNLLAEASLVEPGWTAVAENVGAGQLPPAIQDGFMGSSVHRANILGDYARMGIGAVVDGAGNVWLTERFLR